MTTTMTALEYAKSYAAASRIPESVLTMGGLVELLERIDELKAEVANLNEGARMLHSLATGGASRFDTAVDLQQATDWQDEAVTDPSDVSKYFNGIPATATKTWRERHLNEGG